MKVFPINFSKKKKTLFAYILILVCLLVLVGASFWDIILRYKIFTGELKKVPVEISQNEYPVLKIPIQPDITAKAAIVMDSDSKVVLFSKNPNLLFSMASTTKIMTALVSLEHYKMDDIMTVKTQGVEGVNVGFEKGEKLTFESVLYAMLLPSGNDAALVLAQNYPGGKDEFIKKMNEKAHDLELYDTNFGDSIGLIDSKDYTTPLNLARLASVSLKNKKFKEVVGTKTRTITDISGKKQYVLNNLNRLLGFDGVNGIKTGYTDEAGQVLVTSKVEKDSSGKDHTIIIVVMESQDRFYDTQKLLGLIHDNINYLSIRP